MNKETVGPAQIEAIGKWGVRRPDGYEHLEAIRQPTLVANGDADVICYPINSFGLQQNIANAQLILYPNARATAPSTSTRNSS